ncbi:restriction endonuclease subunit S [Halomonas sp.]|uniref:restriction endonuclease subunit S n=1 Tax=Halomonas sp. TaxID=1486246 RepID=UPI0025C65E74|nr:restriction endonuclease subunit S [Halomonas sp.]
MSKEAMKVNAADAGYSDETEIQDVPPGYKRTELGVIPGDWKVKSIRECGKIVTGGTPSTLIPEYWNGIHPWITPSDISQKRDVYSSERLLTNAGLNAIRELPADTVLITCIASIGKNALLRVRGGCNQQINAIIPDYQHSAEYLYYKLEAAKDYLLGNAGTTATAIISKARFQELIFSIPSLAEQRAIAKALSDADSLLGALDALIAKKRAIKKAAMQQLLTGKTRLPGFSGEWETKRLGNLVDYERPDKYFVQCVQYADSGQVPVLTANKSFILGYTDEIFGVCKDLPVIVFDDFTTEKKFADFPFKVKSSAIKLLRAKNDRVSLRYIFERIQLIRFSIGDHKRYYISEYQNIDIEIPEYEEQTAIANVLSDMDTEITALEERRDKTQQIKQGMMQQLLTGRVRLIPQKTKTP